MSRTGLKIRLLQDRESSIHFECKVMTMDSLRLLSGDFRHQDVETLQGRNPASKQHSAFGGLDEVRSSLKEMLQLPLVYPQTLSSLGLSCPRGVLLVGPPGVGKTQLVRSVVREVGASLVVVHGPEIVGSRPGESEEKLRAVFANARLRLKKAPNRVHGSRKQTGGSAPLSDGRHGPNRPLPHRRATNRPDSLDPALRRPGRFDREVIIGAPTLQQRREILSVLFEKIPVCSSVDVEEVAQRTTGYVGADLSALCREAAMNSIRETAKGSGEQTVNMKHFTEALKSVGPSCLRSSLGRTDLAPVSWEQIGGLDDVKLKLTQLFRQARSCAPCVLFLDEIDSLIGCRSSGAGRRPDSAPVCAAERDGRSGLKTAERRGVERKLQAEGEEQEHQHEQSRLSILKLCTKSIPVSDDVCLEELAQRTSLFSGADLENLCKEAALLALQEENMAASHVKHKYFLQSLSKITPSLTFGCDGYGRSGQEAGRVCTCVSPRAHSDFRNTKPDAEEMLVSHWRTTSSRTQLIPLIGFMAFAATGATSACIYFLFTKTDVVINKSGNPEPWERVDPSKPQKNISNNKDEERVKGGSESGEEQPNHHKPAVEARRRAAGRQGHAQVNPPPSSSRRSGPAPDTQTQLHSAPISLTESFLHKLDFQTLSVRKRFCSTGGVCPSPSVLLLQPSTDKYIHFPFF
ncbi:hypothetical protein WMY93_013172 [Mugilogobius chulae]|uniref:AAA+ ATPase domain-containing protein n=1 Tax=Mugilogobius chulae TaxID=88201 RepID=A0AAW0PBN3_9GOBI